jgi:CubicO group peptidase (beta-lactamase class C family)
MRYHGALFVLAFTLPQATAPPGELGSVIDPFLKQNRVPGLSVAVVRNGLLVVATGFGTSEPGGGRSITGDTRFRVASITKALTAVLVLQLVEKGLFDLDEPARVRCPAFAPAGGDPTLRNLLAHQGGVRHPTDKEDTTISGRFPRLAASVSRLSGEPLHFAPGTDTLYSSWGYTVLGCVVEEATGQSFFDTLRASVLDPARMTTTVADRPDFEDADFTHGFRVVRGRVVRADVVDTRFKQPASGLISSAADLGRFAVALYQHELLPEAAQAALFSRQTTKGGKSTDYSVGLMVGRPRGSDQSFYLAGSMEGTTAILYLIPAQRFAVALLANRERFAPDVASLIPRIIDMTIDVPRG